MRHKIIHNKIIHIRNFVFFSFDGQTIQTEPSSNNEHGYASLARFRNIPMVVGDYNGISVEKFSSGKWNVMDDFPFATSYFYSYSTVTFSGHMLLFGTFLTFSKNAIFFLNKFTYKLENTRPHLTNNFAFLAKMLL